MKNLIIKPVFPSLKILLLTSFFTYHHAKAQTEIHGTVNDLNGKPVANANILLLKPADSSLVKGMFTNNAGKFSFQNINEGKYVVTSTHTGYLQVYTSSFEIKANEVKDLGIIKLAQETTELALVKVDAKKPLLEQKIDRLVINVASSITAAGNTALEILERSPGVSVDHQNNLISLNGKDGVVLIINGKMSHIPVSAVVQLLSGMPSSNIEKIELITTPPANFDAEGNAGYINIVLKQNNNFGTNGSYSASLGYGKGWVEQASLNINHRRGKINFYGDASYSRVKKPLPIGAYSRVSYLGKITERQFTGHRTDTTVGFSGRLGLDYQLNSRSVIGVLFSNNDRYYTQSESNQTSIVINTNPDTLIKLNNSEINHWKNYSANLNFQHSFKEDEKLSLNLDYIYYSNYQPVNYATSYYTHSGNFLYDTLTRSGKSTPINFWVAAIDYSKKLSNKISMEAGVKTTFSAFNNDISFDRYHHQLWVKDALLSAKYKLNEDYEAAYASFNITINKSTEAKAGLRYEYTNSNLGTETIKNIVDRHYGKLFPTLFLSHTINEFNGISFSYSLRITRPTFTDLAPFTYYSDPNTVLTGNASLQPALANTFKADYTYKKYLLSLSYTHTKNAITGFQPESDSAANTLTLSPVNLKNQKEASVIISIPVTIGNWWTMQYNFTGLWQEVNTFYKEKPLKLSQFYCIINASEGFKLPKNFSAELAGFFFSPQLNGIFLQKAFGKLDFGLRKKLADQKSALSFNVSDIFKTMQFGGSTNLLEQNLVSNVLIRFSQRTYKLTFTHNFGNDKLKSKRDRRTGAEEEKERVQY